MWLDIYSCHVIEEHGIYSSQSSRDRGILCLEMSLYVQTNYQELLYPNTSKVINCETAYNVNRFSKSPLLDDLGIITINREVC